MTIRSACVVFILCVCWLQIGIGQVNVKIGYSLLYTSAETNNALIDAYNSENPFFEKQMSDVHFLHGIQIGARYRWSTVGVELGWEAASQKLDAFGEDPNTSDFLSNSLFYSVNSLSLGLENYFGMFGYGATIDRRLVKVRTDIASTSNKRTILSQTEFSSRFYLLFNLQQSSRVSLTIKPFVQFPWTDYDLRPLRNELLGPSSTTQANEDFFIFGLSFLFYNGPQS